MNAPARIEAPTLAKLREPFAANQISKLPKETKAQREAREKDRNQGVRCGLCDGWHHKNAVHLDYVGHAALTDRLLDTDPEWNWEPLALDANGLPAFDRTGGLWIKLTVLGMTRLGYGSADGKSGGDAIKEIIGDALRNAAMRFGAALDLWHKGDLHADDECRDPERREPGPEASSDAASNDPSTGDHMPDAEFARLVNLLKATGVPVKKLLDGYGVPDLHFLNQDQYADAVDQLNGVLARKAKREADAKGKTNWNQVLEDEVKF